MFLAICKLSVTYHTLFTLTHYMVQYIFVEKLWDLKVHYCVHKSLVPSLSQMNLVHIPICFFKIYI
jgi:hypothetical protein